MTSRNPVRILTTEREPAASELPVSTWPVARRSVRSIRRGIGAFVALLALALVGCDRPMPLDEIKRLQAEGRYAETVEPLRKHLDASPDDPETHLLYGMALSRTGASRVAVWSLRKAAETESLTVPAQLELASTQVRISNFREAIEAATAVIDLEPENVMAHILRGEARLSMGEDPEKALEDFELVLEREPGSLAALTAKASALLLLERVDDAAATIAEIESVAEKDPSDEATRAQLCAVHAVLAHERGQADQALERFDDCVERFPGWAVVVDPAIGFFDARNERERSDSILEKALELVPESISYRRTLALRKEAAGKSDEALAIFERGLETEDRELKIQIWTDLTNYHLDRDELPESIAAFEQALSLVDEPQQLAILTHADLLARAGRHEEARRVAEDLDNEHFVSLIEARISLDQGDPKGALARLDEVFPHWPNNAGARYYAARAAERLGDFPRAIEEYRQSIRSGPEQTEAALRLAKLYLAIGSFEDAWTNAGQYMSSHGQDPEGARVAAAAAARDEKASLHGMIAQLRGTPLWAPLVAGRARFLAERQDARAALAWIDGIPGPKPDWTSPAIGELILQRALLLHEAEREAEADRLIADALAKHPGDSRLLAAQAALLEARSVDPALVQKLYDEAIAKDPKNWVALDGAARARERAGDLAGAIELFDRSTTVHPESPVAARRAAELADRSGVAKEKVAERWKKLLEEHPWDAESARALARLHKESGDRDAVTLDLAERAVMFGGGQPAQALLVALHDERGETERARELERAFREGKPIPPRNPRGADGAGSPRAQPAPAPAAPSGSARPASPAGAPGETG